MPSPTVLRFASHVIVAMVTLSLLSGPFVELVAGSEPVSIIGMISGLTGEVVILPKEDDHGPTDWEKLDWRRLLAKSRAQLGQSVSVGDIILTRGGVVQLRFSTAVEGTTEMGVNLVECRLGNSTEVHLSRWNAIIAGSPSASRVASVFELRRGEARCITEPLGRIEHNMRWQAGSTSVLIKGTDLTMTYFPEGDRLIVTVAEGKVVVAGPGGSRVVDSEKGTVVFIGGVPQEDPPA